MAERNGNSNKTGVDARGRRFSRHKIADFSELKEGDHIFCNRAAGAYTHHGIYVGKDMVIHFLDTRSNEVVHNGVHCENCGYVKNGHHGVVETCLDCFLGNGHTFAGAKLSLFLYGVSETEYLKRAHRYCSILPSKPSHEVVTTAYGLLENGFGKYNLVFNNCEDFATYCKTGRPHSCQVEAVAVGGGALVAAGGAVAAVAALWYYLAKKKKEKKKKNASPTEENEERVEEHDSS